MKPLGCKISLLMLALLVLPGCRPSETLYSPAELERLQAFDARVEGVYVRLTNKGKVAGIWIAVSDGRRILIGSDGKPDDIEAFARALEIGRTMNSPKHGSTSKLEAG